jgi:hypothetical protein
MEATGLSVTKETDKGKRLDRSKVWTPERLAKLHWIIDTDSPEAEDLREKVKAILTQ